MSYKHVLVALDLGTDVMNLVGKAANIAERDDALLSVIHVDMDIAEYYGGIMSFDFGQYKQTAHHESIVALQHQLAQIPLPIENRIVCTGAIEEEINRTIQTNHIDLLVMAAIINIINSPNYLFPSQHHWSAKCHAIFYW
ncbi:universal stress protein [Vibrio sp. PP-XX7]